MKKLTLTLLLLLCLTVIVCAQALTPPEFPGGKNAFHDFLNKNISWPDKSANIQGIVTVGFTVENDGQLTNVHIVKSLSPKLDREAMRVIHLSPKWVPARQNNKFIKSNYSVPISFIVQMMQPVKVKDVQLSPGHDADITIDEPISESDANDPPDKIYTSVERAPQFPGGMARFFQYIEDGLKNEKISEADAGRLIVSFVAERDGSLTEVKIARSVTAKSDALALKLLKNSPKWLPGMRYGRPVRVAFAVPVPIKPNI